ncbi:MAG: excinuclease ABC subunit UvrC [Flavobacteriales bacterium]|nr:UvrABC system protein C [Flavobacteriales bacterium]MCC6577609.1 excinuclease ABC subunit UvrC [Flavobacteriales bacterium]NUQ14287.1 excinuclease ABC subunit UvrC [Flavobacteriales bacterium]
MNALDVRDKVRLLPHAPGVYQFFDSEGKILYVGKATSLRSRVGSYFAKNHPDGKTRLLVSKIADLRTILTSTPYDALLLENSLIKEFQPRYNILLRDDKSYPWIRIRNEHYPRIEGMRNPVDDGSEYIGPFASAGAMHTALKLVHKLYKLRTCNYDLSPENVAKGKYKRCLEWHMGNCRGPCEGLQSEEDYDAKVAQARQVLKGRIGGVVRLLKEQMQVHAEKLEFEQAEEMRVQIEQLEKYQARSTVVSPTVGDVDVFGLARNTQSTFVNYMRVIDGAVVHGVTVELKRRLDEPDEEVLQYAIAELRQRFRSNAPEAVVPMDPGIEMPGLAFTVPQRGDKKHLLEMGERNANYFMLEKQKQEALVDPEAATDRILEQLKQDLRLTELPRHIECFDNSNTQGTDPVSACVVFKDAKPSKKDYRHFNIRTVQGPDDFASMEEAVERRYARLLTEGEPLPQLVVIDGGKGQLHAALNVFDRLGLRGKVALVGIAKNLEEIFFPGDPYPLHIDKRSSSLRLIQHMRNEAHRFGITHHRGKRSKRIVRTGLEDIPGIGPATAQKLLTRFGSIQGIREAKAEEVAQEIGAKKAEVLMRSLGPQGPFTN